MTNKATIIKSLTDGVDQFNELINNVNGNILLTIFINIIIILNLSYLG
ncbi:MAG: hypothetical protein RL188_967 [Bacteroidota bacterium]|jgi:hypothetical protein